MDEGYRFNRGKIIMGDMDVTIFQLQKSEIIHQKFDRLLTQLKEIDGLKNKGFSSLMLSIEGWDDVPEELYEIAQVRRFMSKLIKKVPHLLFYLNPTNQMPHQVLASLSNVEKFYKGPVTIPEYNQGRHQALIQLPADIADMMTTAIQNHAENVGFEDKHNELPVIYKIIEGVKNN